MEKRLEDECKKAREFRHACVKFEMLKKKRKKHQENYWGRAARRLRREVWVGNVNLGVVRI